MLRKACTDIASETGVLLIKVNRILLHTLSSLLCIKHTNTGFYAASISIYKQTTNITGLHMNKTVNKTYKVNKALYKGPTHGVNEYNIHTVSSLYQYFQTPGLLTT